MRARIDITEAETRTKIRAKYLRAIENEEWDLLPGPVYVRSFLRTYGDFLGRSATNNKPAPAPVPARRTAQKPHPATHRAPPPPRPKAVTLQLIPTGRVYVCLVDAHGKALIPGVIYDPGQTVPTEKASKLLLTLGNASVQMKVNGKPLTVASSASSIGYLLSPAGAKPLSAAHQPRCA